MVIEKKKRNTYNNNYDSSIFMFLCFLCFAFIVESKPNYKIKQTIIKNKEESGGIAQVIDRFYDKNSEPSGIVPCHFLRPASASTDDKLSIPITQWRERHPTSYCVKFESFTDMRNLIGDGKYESRRFSVGGYNWTFVIHPTGDRGANVINHVSVYAKIDNSSLITNPEDVHAEVKFFVYNRNRDNYWVYQETDAQRFHLFNPKLGQPRFRTTAQMNNEGFIFEGGQSVFGIDVFVAQPFKSWEVFSFVNNTNAIHTWDITDFSHLYHTFYRSGWFILEGKSWDLKMYPNGDGSGQGNSLSLYLLSGANEETYVKAKLRIVDQIRNNDEEKEVEGWPTAKQNGWGFEKFISLGDLKDETKGFIVNDVLRIQVEILAFTKTDFIN